MTPTDRKYTATHEWIKIEGQVALVGITDHAQQALGDITYVDVTSAGRKVQQGGEYGVIESVKAASDIYAPVSGDVAEVNPALSTSPETINKDPYGAGWILKIRNFDAGQMGALLDAAGYEASLGNS